MNNSEGSAYLLVMVLMAALFLMTATAIGISASGRRTSVRYIYFAGLYDLAVSGCERAKILLRYEVENQKEDIAQEIITNIKARGIKNYLIYEDGSFYIDGFMPLFRLGKINALNVFINEALNGPAFIGWQARQWRYFSYELSVSTGTYKIKTHIFHTGGGNYDVVTTALKEVSGSSGTPMHVQGRINWPAFNFRPVFIPLSYSWRADVPPFFDSAVKKYAPLNTLNWGILPTSHNWTEENAVTITNYPYIYTNDFASVPMIIIYTGLVPLEIYGTQMFNGIIISNADVNINVHMRGSVISGGTVNYLHIIYDPYMLFSVPMDKHMKKIIFDFLGITNFSSGVDINEILGYVYIANFKDICFEPLSRFKPRLSALQNVAN